MGARIWLTLLLICAGLLGWEAIVPSIVSALAPGLSELPLYAIDKLGFAAALALLLTGRGLWPGCGFAGGLRLDRMVLLWPLWLVAALSASGGLGETDPLRLAGWFAVSAAVGFGEEGVFRGLIMAALGDRPRRAVVVSSVLFGLLHLAGLLTPADYRFILAQAAAAACLGLVLGAVRLLAGSIWPGIIAHAALDFFGLAAAGGLSSAMGFSLGAVIVELGCALAALAWAAILIARLPPGRPRLSVACAAADPSDPRVLRGSRGAPPAPPGP
jgi:membrane protease YdiL (CAAX protease family)